MESFLARYPGNHREYPFSRLTHRLTHCPRSRDPFILSARKLS